MAQYLFGWPHDNCLFGSQWGGWSCIRGFDTQPAQWGQALKTAMLCRAFNLLYYAVVHIVWFDMVLVWNGRVGG